MRTAIILGVMLLLAAGVYAYYRSRAAQPTLAPIFNPPEIGITAQGNIGNLSPTHNAASHLPPPNIVFPPAGFTAAI